MSLEQGNETPTTKNLLVSLGEGEAVGRRVARGVWRWGWRGVGHRHGGGNRHKHGEHNRNLVHIGQDWGWSGLGKGALGVGCCVVVEVCVLGSTVGRWKMNAACGLCVVVRTWYALVAVDVTTFAAVTSR